MEIITKFNVGQEVWLIHENIVVKQIVEYIETQTYNNGCVDTDIIYHLGWEENFDGDDYKIKNVKESRLFSTREDLILSL